MTLKPTDAFCVSLLYPLCRAVAPTPSSERPRHERHPRTIVGDFGFSGWFCCGTSGRYLTAKLHFPSSTPASKRSCQATPAVAVVPAQATVPRYRPQHLPPLGNSSCWRPNSDLNGTRAGVVTTDVCLDVRQRGRPRFNRPSPNFKTWTARKTVLCCWTKAPTASTCLSPTDRPSRLLPPTKHRR
jgi:hypothetical protein